MRYLESRPKYGSSERMHSSDNLLVSCVWLTRMPLGALCRSLIFTVRALCDRECQLSRAQTAPWHEAYALAMDTILLGPKAKLPGYIPGAGPGVATPQPACVIRFVVC